MTEEKTDTLTKVQHNQTTGGFKMAVRTSVAMQKTLIALMNPAAEKVAILESDYVKESIIFEMEGSNQGEKEVFARPDSTHSYY